MFDPLKPNNNLPKLPTDFNYDQVEILKRVTSTSRVLAKLDSLASRLPNSALLISPLLVRESVASSGVENINTTVMKAFEAEILPESKRQGPSKEVLHYKDAMLQGLELVRAKGFLATNDFVKIQKLVEPNKGGIRRMEVKIANQATKEILYTPPLGEDTIRDLLANLDKFINNHEDGIDPLIKVSVFHYQFESIHPFLDGNGRVGRILSILYLVMTGMVRFPVLYLSGYILENRSDYYKILRKTNKTGDFTDLILFFLEAIEKQANETIETVLKIEQLMKKFERSIDKNKKMKIPSGIFLDCLFSKPLVSIDYVQKSLELSSRQTASKYLAYFKEKGLLEEKKIGLFKIFYSEEFIKLLS